MAAKSTDEVEFPASDGTLFFARRFTPSSGPANRNLVIVHGMSEHGGRYSGVAEMFADCGWNVVVPDQRGHGLSGGVRTHVDRFDQYLGDLSELLNYFQLPAERTGILGHSMGSLVAIRFGQQYPGRVSAMTLLAPLLGLKVEVHPLTIAIGKVMSRLYPKLRYRSRVRARDTTRTEAVVKDRLDDPLLERTITAGCFFEMMQAIRAAHRDSKLLTTPLFVLQGACDRIVDPLAVEPWLKSTSATEKKFSWLAEHYHELHQEPDAAEILAQIAGWFDERIPSGSGDEAPSRQ